MLPIFVVITTNSIAVKMIVILVIRAIISLSGQYFNRLSFHIPSAVRYCRDHGWNELFLGTSRKRTALILNCPGLGLVPLPGEQVLQEWDRGVWGRGGGGGGSVGWILGFLSRGDWASVLGPSVKNGGIPDESGPEPQQAGLHGCSRGWRSRHSFLHDQRGRRWARPS